MKIALCTDRSIQTEKKAAMADSIQMAPYVTIFKYWCITSHQRVFRVINWEVTKFRAKMNNIHIFPISVVTPFLIWQLTMPAASLRN